MRILFPHSFHWLNYFKSNQLCRIIVHETVQYKSQSSSFNLHLLVAGITERLSQISSLPSFTSNIWINLIFTTNSILKAQM